MKYTKITPDIETKVVELRKGEMLYKEIGLRLNIHEKTVGKILKQHGVNHLIVYVKNKVNCLQCQKEFEVYPKDSKRFCNRSCSATFYNIRRASPERAIKITARKELNIKYADYTGKERINKIREDKLLSDDFDKMCYDRKKKRIIAEQNGSCICGLSEWMGKKLSLEVDHKDGNNRNDKRENLRALCPNCHAITDTWRGRNKRVNRKPIPMEAYKDAFLANDRNVYRALNALGISPKGGNYKKMYSILDSFDISYIKQSKIA